MSELSKILPEQLDFRSAITTAEAILFALPEHDKTEPEVIHHFAPGVYMRELRIKKGTILTGAIHKTEHLCILNGDIEIASEDGKGRFTGYLTFKSKPGVKRIGYAHEDTVFTTVHPTHETDIPTILKQLVVFTFEDYDAYLLECAAEKHRLSDQAQSGSL